MCPKQMAEHQLLVRDPGQHNPKAIVTRTGKRRKLELTKFKSHVRGDAAGKEQGCDSKPVWKMLELHSEPEGFSRLLG